jgi:CRP-like cAMP-binding protein
MPTQSTLIKNRLLLALPRKDLDHVKRHLEDVECSYRQVLAEADGTLEHVHFPDDGVISVLAVYPDGNSIEMATLGREGATGFQAVLGAKVSSARLLVQVPGRAHRMSHAAFDRALKDVPSFRVLMFAHVHALLEQVLISTACNAAHSVRQRLARWLLMMRDRHDEDTLPITQDLIAEMLGVHRPTVTKAVRSLERRKLVEIGRKRVSLLDRDGLAKVSCECYQMARMRTAQHLPKTYPT